MASRFDQYLEQVEPGRPNEEAAQGDYEKYLTPSVAQDVTSAAPSALGRIPFAIAGAPAAFADMGALAARWLDSKIGSDPVETSEEVMARMPWRNLRQGALEQTFFEQPTGVPFYDPQTNVGKDVAATITGAGAGALTGGVGAGPGSLGISTLSGAGGGLGSELGRQQFEGTDLETPMSIVGGIAGGMVPSVARRAVTPRYVSPQRARMAAILRGYGGPSKGEGITTLTEGQVTGNKRLQAKELQRVPGTHQTSQYEELTQAALRRIGVKGKYADDYTMDRTFGEISNEYTRLSNNNILRPDAQLGQGWKNAWDEYSGLVGEPNRSPAIGRYREELLNQLKKGPDIPGTVYQSLRSRMQETARTLTKSGGEGQFAGKALFQMVNDLDDAMERSISATNPRDAGAFRTLRTRYRNILVVEDAVSRPGEWSNQGLITPEALNSAVKRWQGDRNFVRGKGPYADLSRAASSLMTPLRPTGHNPLNPADILSYGVMAPIEAVKRGIGVVRMLPGVQRYLTNRLLPTKPIGKKAGLRRTVVPTLPSIGSTFEQNYNPVVDALQPGQQGPASQIDPRIQQIIDALGGAGQ